MTNIEKSGWNINKIGDINHQNMSPPFIRLAEYKIGAKGDVISLYDFRIKQPNKEHLEPIILHSMEHILLEGFRHYIPENLINVAPMGCQTGFYIILLNYIKANEVINILTEVLKRACTLTNVPYSNDKQCGQAIFHDINKPKLLIEEILKGIENIKMVADNGD